MPGLSPEARSSEHGLERRFAIDRITPFPFRDLPRTEADFTARFGDDAKTIGRLPWLAHESYERLVTAFKGGDKGVLLKESDTLSDLLADLHNPLALSDNADGQKAGQHGLWVRFTDRFPSRVHSLGLKADGAHLIDDPAGYLYSIVNGTYIWLDNVLYADDLAHRQDPAYGGVYYETLDERAGRILIERLSWAARDVASYWYTAWTAAGRPEMK